MARYPTEHKEATRARILAASERVLKRDGFDGASVEAVMRAAGMTVGGFYAHFASKEDLSRQALLYSVEQSFARLTEGLEDVDDRTFLRMLIERYLAQAEDPALEHACPLTLLLPEVARSDASFRVEFATRGSSSASETALAVFAALAGSVAMARAAATPSARRKIAQATGRLLCSALGLDRTPAPTTIKKSRNGDSRKRGDPAY